MALNNPNVYSYSPQHTDIQGTFGDFETSFVKSWSAKPGAVKETLIYGRSKNPIGRTQGKADPPEFTCTLYYPGWNDLRDYLTSKSPDKKLSNAIIDIVLLINTREGAKRVDVTAARLLSYEIKSDEGEAPLEIALTWGVADVTENGMPIL